MIGCRILNLMFLFYCFNSYTAFTAHRKQGRENEEIIDGTEFMERILSGSKLTTRPKFLMFTAPYKLCEGECSDETLAIGFPVYLGKYGKKVYKDTDIHNLQNDGSNSGDNKNKTNPSTDPPKIPPEKSTEASPKPTDLPETIIPKPKKKGPKGSTRSTKPIMFIAKNKKDKLNKILQTDCPCPYLDPNICVKKRHPDMREKQEIIVDDIKKLFTLYRKTKDII